jgi:hypothetical protein
VEPNQNSLSQGTQQNLIIYPLLDRENFPGKIYIYLVLHRKKGAVRNQQRFRASYETQTYFRTSPFLQCVIKTL